MQRGGTRGQVVGVVRGHGHRRVRGEVLHFAPYRVGAVGLEGLVIVFRGRAQACEVVLEVACFCQGSGIHLLGEGGRARAVLEADSHGCTRIQFVHCAVQCGGCHLYVVGVVRGHGHRRVRGEFLHITPYRVGAVGLKGFVIVCRRRNQAGEIDAVRARRRHCLVDIHLAGKYVCVQTVLEADPHIIILSQ